MIFIRPGGRDCLRCSLSRNSYPAPSASPIGRSAIRVRRALNRARLLPMGSSCTRAERKTARQMSSRLSLRLAAALAWRSLASAARFRSRPARFRSRAASSALCAASCAARNRDPDASLVSTRNVASEAALKGIPHCCWSAMVRPKAVMWSVEEKRAIRLKAMPPSTWSTPRRSRSNQRRGGDADFGGSGSSGASSAAGWGWGWRHSIRECGGGGRGPAARLPME
jgi:hypothetical protein